MCSSLNVQNRVKRVLLVDDVRTITVLMSSLLRGCGYTVESVNDSRLAAEAVRRFQPDVILLDINMPHIDGYQVARNVRADPATRHITIIALTTHRGDEHLRQCKKAGIDSSLFKPCDLATLSELIEQVAIDGS